MKNWGIWKQENEYKKLFYSGIINGIGNLAMRMHTSSVMGGAAEIIAYGTAVKVTKTV